MKLESGIVAQLFNRYSYYIIPIIIYLLIKKYILKPKDNKNVKKEEARKTKGSKQRDSDDDSSDPMDGGDGRRNKDTDHLHDLGSDTHLTPYKALRFSETEMAKRSEEFYMKMNKRRSIRFFSDKPVPIEVIRNIIKTAGTAPSGAHTEPWTYVVVSDQDTKSEIRHIIESEERINYERRMGEVWKTDLHKLHTNWEKPYLDKAPYLVAVFKQTHSYWPNGDHKQHYYSEMSTCISVGLMLAAIQNAGLVTLTSTPMNAGPALRKLLDRPSHEKVILLLPIGYPAEDAKVPDFSRKSLDEIMVVK